MPLTYQELYQCQYTLPNREGVRALMDFGILCWVAGAGLNEVQEAPGFRSYITPTPPMLPAFTIIRQRTRR